MAVLVVRATRPPTTMAVRVGVEALLVTLPVVPGVQVVLGRSPVAEAGAAVRA